MQAKREDNSDNSRVRCRGGMQVCLQPGAVATVGAALLLLLAGCGETGPAVPERADPQRGRFHIERLGCGSCHRIPGIGSARGEVGPPLDEIAKRAYLAGVLPNHFDNMVRWVLRPQSVAPGSAMPNIPMTDAEAEDIAAYLYTLD